MTGDAYKKFKQMLEAGQISIPKPSSSVPVRREGMKLAQIASFIPVGLCSNPKINVTVFDHATEAGYRLNLITGKYYMP